MKIRQLEAFRAVMIHQTVTLASEHLHISQPAATRLLADLEGSIGFKLFDRVKGRLYPTAEAEALFKEVQRSLIGVDRIARAADEIRDLRRGTLQIAAAPALASSFLPHAITAYLIARPEAEISLTQHSSRTILDMVVGQRCDVGFVTLSMSRSRPSGQNLFSAWNVCALPAGHPLCLKDSISTTDIADEAFIAHPRSGGNRLALDGLLAAHGKQLNIRMECQVSHSLCSFVEAGAGIAIVDTVTAWGYRGTGVVFRPFEDSFTTDFSMLTPPHRPAPLLLQSFITHVREFARRELGEDSILF